jgi:hypothetical protein
LAADSREIGGGADNGNAARIEQSGEVGGGRERIHEFDFC